ncbi:MAG: LON peptidase substrate-binding domain-containing protein [Phycisphaeraceae bacterium]|nr:LON peptidase substrate-binding domain-containing protein [Phycisphaeraceae bacterium]
MATTESSSPQTLTVPLFALDRCILLPGASTPLHIFEPRYRAMVDDLLEAVTDAPLAMGVYGRPAAPSLEPDQKPIRQAVCLGRIAQHQSLPGGRHQIIVEGIARAVVEGEASPATGGYRRLHVRRHAMGRPMEIDLAEYRSAIRHRLAIEDLDGLAGIARLRELAAGDLSTDALVDAATLLLLRGPDDAYHQLEEPDGRHRAQWLIDHLEELIRAVRYAQPFEGDAVQDGVGIN